MGGINCKPPPDILDDSESIGDAVARYTLHLFAACREFAAANEAVEYLVLTERSLPTVARDYFNDVLARLSNSAAQIDNVLDDLSDIEALWNRATADAYVKQQMTKPLRSFDYSAAYQTWTDAGLAADSSGAWSAVSQMLQTGGEAEFWRSRIDKLVKVKSATLQLAAEYQLVRDAVGRGTVQSELRDLANAATPFTVWLVHAWNELVSEQSYMCLITYSAFRSESGKELKPAMFTEPVAHWLMSASSVTTAIA